MPGESKLKYRRLVCDKEIPNGIADIKKKIVCTNYEPHWHDFIELDYYFDGDGKNIINGKEYTITPGSVFILGPTDLHEIKVHSPTTVLTAMISPLSLSREMLGSIVGEENVIHHALTGVKRERFEALLDMLIDEQRWREPYNELCMKSLISVCLAMVMREHLRKNPGNGTYSADAKDRKEFAEAISYIMLNFTKNPSLTEISDALGYNASYFSKRFGELYGMPYKEYLLRTKLSFAKSLLLSGNLGISEVGYLSGFSSTQTFVSDFRKSFGVTPTQFRKTKNISDDIQTRKDGSQ